MIKNDPINRYHRDPQLGYYKLICEFLLLVALLHLPALLAQLPMRRALPLWRQTLQLSLYAPSLDQPRNILPLLLPNFVRQI